MDALLVEYRLYIAGGAMLLATVLYFLRKRRLRRERIDNEIWMRDALAQLRDDPFYCIMRDDGKCSSGFIDRE